MPGGPQGHASKSWFVKYVHNGTQRRMTLGQLPSISLAVAKQSALSVKYDRVINKADPALQQKQDRNALTLKELIDLYMDMHAKEKRSPGKKMNVSSIIILNRGTHAKLLKSQNLNWCHCFKPSKTKTVARWPIVALLAFVKLTISV